MRQLLYSALTAIIMFAVAACTNDDITITQTGNLEVKVSTEDLYNPLDASDYQDYLGKHTNCGITTRILIYDNDGKLVKEDEQQVKTISTMTFDINDLKEGRYTLVALQTIKNNSDNLTADDLSYFWQISDKDELSKLHIDRKRLEIYWYGALGIATRTFQVGSNNTISVNPQPAGYLLSFGYENVKNTDLVEMAFYNHNRMDGLYIDPARTGNDKFYKKEYNQSRTWDFIGYFLDKTNGIEESGSETLFVIETGTQTVCLGYANSTLKDKNQFYAVPNNGVNLNFQIGKEYVAYGIYNNAAANFDYYIGEQSGFAAWYNSHRNENTTYFDKPVTDWGATVSYVKSCMSNYECGNENGEVVENDGTYILWYKGLYSEDEIDYYFSEKTGDLFRSYIFISQDAISNESITNYLKQYDYTLVTTSDDGLTKIFTSKDGKTAVESGLNSNGYWYICFYNPNHEANQAPAKSIKHQANRHARR